MLSPDVRFEGFTATDWTRFLSLFRPRRPSGADRDPDRPRGGVVAVHDRGCLVKLLHTQVGRLRLDDARRDWPLRADELARRHHASWAASIESGALESVMDRFASRARRGDDLTTQVATFLALLRDEVVAGRLTIWPARLAGVPIPSPGVVRGTLDSVCAVGRSMVIGLFEEGELWTSIVLRRAPTGFDLVLGPDEVRADMGLLAGDWRRDYRHLARAAEERASLLAFGCFAEVATFRRLEVDPTPGAWARAAVVRDIILSPLPAPLALPLGIDAGRAAVGLLRTVAERFDPVGIVGPGVSIVRELAGLDDGSHPGSFRPLELLRRLLTRDR